ncbi:MAG: ribonuclease III domain-containing protein [Clostridia bacterium]|jgi:ribonuclease-3 family protein|nr:ribonuclease III domain-containing protein [Clostridia bacterium]
MEIHFMPVYSEPDSIEKAKTLPAEVLAFIGDAVQTLFVRTKFSKQRNCKIQTLHNLVSKEINATSQANALKNIESLLNDDEISVFKRCRNSHKQNIPKNSSVASYNLASGFEGVLGYLYLTGQKERLSELMAVAYPEENK